ncbi:hypothetical protein NIES4071_82050 [Calothrix sp. NIES-4071]|nr:hypothetical protein NIES4071_82050 [Calothrix sp. NIES-4071]BAZ62474.1 hypothetical protein NIES4105_81980 [Calothrix sp. NIES-4105]
MTNLNVQIPNSLYKQIEAKAAKENVPIDQLVVIARFSTGIRVGK